MNKLCEQEKLDTPLEGDLSLSSGCRGLFDMDYINGVYSTLRFDRKGKLPVYNAAGRNFYIPLPRPLGVFDGLQVAGGGNFELGIRSTDEVPHCVVFYNQSVNDTMISPPSEDSGLFSSSTTYYENGRLINRTNETPVGSYSTVSAERKIACTRKIAEKLMGSNSATVTPIQIGKFEYEVRDQNGDPQVAILMLVPNMGKRLGSRALLPLKFAHNNPDDASAEFATVTDSYYAKVLQPNLAVIGSGIAEIHKLGVNHNQLTGDNVDTLSPEINSSVPYVTDWDTMTTPSDEDKPRAQATDLITAIRSASAQPIILHEKGFIDEDSAFTIITRIVVSILEGYFVTLGKPFPADITTKDVFDLAIKPSVSIETLDIIADLLS